MVSSAWQTVVTGLMMILIVLPGSPVQTQPNEAGACQKAYGSISSADTLPEWLQTEVGVETLHTENRYDLLAGHLLSSGIVDGSQCFGWGLNTDGSPNGCGVEVAKSSVIEWQNQYDEAIVDASKSYGLSARLIKSMIAVETQFWPGSDWEKGEIGLGQLTDAGADMVLTCALACFKALVQRCMMPKLVNTLMWTRNPGYRQLCAENCCNCSMQPAQLVKVVLIRHEEGKRFPYLPKALVQVANKRPI